MAGARVKLERVTKSYLRAGSSSHVLDAVDAEIVPGEFVAIVGRSGSGRSTLLNLIGAIDTPTSGEVCVDDAALSALDETGRALMRRRRIGFVFQFFNLIPTLTAAENLQLPLDVNGVSGARSGTALSDRFSLWYPKFQGTTLVLRILVFFVDWVAGNGGTPGVNPDITSKPLTPVHQTGGASWFAKGCKDWHCWLS